MLLFSATGCQKENALSGSLDGISTGLISVSLSWDNKADAGSPVYDVNLSLENDQYSISHTFSSIEEVSKQYLRLPEGDYELMVRVNMSEQNGLMTKVMPPTFTQMTYKSLGSVVISVNESSRISSQAWFGMTRIYVEKGDISNADIQLQRLLKVLPVSVDSLPANARMVFSMGSVASDVNLTSYLTSGDYGVPSQNRFGPLRYDTVTFARGGKQSMDYYLFPPGLGQDSSKVSIDLITDTDRYSYKTTIQYMYGGKPDTLRLKFDDLR